MAAVVESIATYEEEHAVIDSMPLYKSPPATTRLTLEQANKLAAGRPFELIHGRMVFKMPDDLHSEAQARLSAKLVNYFDANPIGRVRTEFTLRLWPDKPTEGRVPDVSVILNENLQSGERYGSRAPDLAIEIISRDDSWTELFEKAKLYFEKGSRMVWFFDPFEQGVEVVTPNSRKWVPDTLTCPELLPGFSIQVQDIFNWPSTPNKKTE
jgi:Uma2 family endonuclease